MEEERHEPGTKRYTNLARPNLGEILREEFLKPMGLSAYELRSARWFRRLASTASFWRMGCHSGYRSMPLPILQNDRTVLAEPVRCS